MTPRMIAGRYDLLEPVGSGWRAVDTELGREVLVRLLAPGDQSPVAAAAMLAHPNVARVFDQGEADAQSYVVLEYLPGGSLDERVAELDENAAYSVAAGIAAALAHAHGRGVAHGSLSTASVFLDGEGRAKVVGFGATGEPADDVRAFGQILISLAAAAPALGVVVPLALAGELDSAELLERIDAAAPTSAPAEETTLIQRPPPAARRRYGLVALAAALALLAAGVGAAFLATSGDSTTDGRTTGQASVPSSTSATEPTTAVTGTQPETTTATTTSGQATTTAPATPSPPTAPVPSTAPPPTETQPPLPTAEPPPSTEPATTEAPPPATTEAPPPTTTEAPPPTTTEQPPTAAATTSAQAP